MDRPRCTTDRIHDVCSEFAWNWRVDEAELYARVEAALPRWPTFDQIALAASRVCQTKARERPQPS